MEKSVKIMLELEEKDSNLHPEKRNISVGHQIRNAEHTSDEKAAVGDSWKRYWQIFAAEDYPSICPFCGEELKEDDIDGCHINIQRLHLYESNTYYPDKKYIIPGHHACNMQLGDEFVVECDILAVEAIEKD